MDRGLTSTGGLLGFMCTEGAGVCGFLAVGEGGEFSRLLHKHLRPFDTHPTWPPETQSPQCYPCQVLTCQFWETKVELGSFLSIRGDPAGSLSGLAWLTPCFLKEQFSLCIYEKAGWSICRDLPSSNRWDLGKGPARPLINITKMF